MESNCKCPSGLPTFNECDGNCSYARPILVVHKHWQRIICARVRRAIVAHAKKKPLPKSEKALEKILGYRFKILVLHVERKLRPGMSWDNISEWSIDHIVPQFRFPANGPAHPNIKRCWKLKNLQVLWADENSRKSVNSWCVL